MRYNTTKQSQHFEPPGKNDTLKRLKPIKRMFTAESDKMYSQWQVNNNSRSDTPTAEMKKMLALGLENGNMKQ